MPKVRVKLNSPGVAELLNDEGVRDHLEGLAAMVASAAISSAPVAKENGGAYRDSIDYGTETTDRAVGRVWADVDYALLVEARTGNLARALDAVMGDAQDELQLVDYTTRSGKKRKATRRQVANWTRGRG